MPTPNDLIKRLSDDNTPRLIRLHGKKQLSFDKSKKLFIGHGAVEGLIPITRPHAVIDGSDAVVEVTVKDCVTNDTALFSLESSAENVEIRNLRLIVRIENTKNSTNTFSVIHSVAPGLKLYNCHIDVFSDKQISLIGIDNNGNRNTHLNTLADNMVVSDCRITLTCLPEAIELPCTVCGIRNRLANSISVENSFVQVTNRGTGEAQKAVGIDTDGRFGRFVGNNIKANATHNEGLLKEQGLAIGFINNGMYSLISSNNLVGEWAGKSIGLDSSGRYADITGNKILATHTICGRSLRLYGEGSIVNGNIITSTSRNARLIELASNGCVICNNVMEVLLGSDACQSGVGIYAVGENISDNSITGNIIHNVRNVGILADFGRNRLDGNQILSSNETRKIVDLADKKLIALLDEAGIQSII